MADKNGQAGKEQKLLAAPPESIWQLLKLMVSGFIRSIPKAGLWFLVKSVAVFFAIMYVNYYYIAVKNEGYGGTPVPGTVTYYLFNLGANKAAFNILVAVASFLLTSIFSQIKSRGFKGFFTDLFHTFSWAGYCTLKAGRWSLPSLLFTAGLMMLVGFFVNNRVLFITLAIGQFFGFISQNRNLTYVAVRVGWNDVQKTFLGRKPGNAVNEGVAGLLPLGFMLGALTLILVPFQYMKVLSFLLMVLFIGLGIFLSLGKTTPRAVASILVFVGVNLLWFRLFGRIFADDGGKNEIGGNFGNYLRDPAGQMIVTNGVQPGILGALGGLLGSMVSGGVSAAGTAYDAAASAAGYVKDGVKSAYNSAANAAGNAYDAAANAAGFVKDGVKSAYNSAANAAGNVYDAAANAAGYLKDGVKSAYNSAANAAGNVYDTAASAVGNAYDAVASTAGNLVDGAGYVWDVASGTVSGTVGQIVDTGLYVVGGILSEGAGLVSDLGRGTWDLITDSSLRNDWFNNMYNDIGNMKDTAVGAVTGLAQAISDYNTDPELRDAFWSNVYNTLTGAESAIGNAATNAWNSPDKWGAVSNLAGQAWDGFSNIVNDPEKVYDTIKSLTGVKSFENSWDPNRGPWERVGYSVLGTFEAYGAISTAQAGQEIIGSRIDNFLGSYSDDAARSIAAQNARNMTAEEAANLGQRGDFIHTGYIDDPKFMTKDSLAEMRRIAQETGEPIYIRLGNEQSVRWIESGEAVPKDLWIKNKTINSIDEVLGARPGSQGLVGYFEPKLPADFASRSAAEQVAIQARFNHRMAEIEKYGPDINRLVRNGQLEIQEGGILAKPGVNGTDSLPYAGDNDIFHASAAAEKAALDSASSGVTHGGLTNYPNYTGPHGFNPTAYDSMRGAATTRGGTNWIDYNPSGGVVSFNPDGTVTKAFVANPTFKLPTATTVPNVFVGAEGVKAATQ